MSGISSWFDFMQEDWSDIWALTWEHGVMVVQVMVAATIFSVALGILVQGKTFGFLREPSLVIASVFLTIPSLALFTLFIPVFGIGKWPPRVALFMYAILPILRNTVTGLDSVDPAIEESAKGMGMSSARRLFQIRIPLAMPVIVTGIRVATLLTCGIAAIATLVAGGGLGDFALQWGYRRWNYEVIWITVGVIVVIVQIAQAVGNRLSRAVLRR